MPSGPLAFLPLNEGQSSIVWTLPADKADYYLAMSDDNFNVAISVAFDARLGDVSLVSQRAAFPLSGQQARYYIAEGVALVGDAAHTIHPLAGQGVNLGIKDVVKLTQVLAGIKTKQIGLKALRRYERARRGDNVMTQKAMEGFQLLFGNTFLPLQLARNMGLSVVNKITPIKNEIIRQAMGL
jgi:2-octaprenylphenol hydroxylase